MNLRDHLQAVYNRHGQLTPALVVQEATPEDHPLHSRFTWDNNVAADAYRRVQAQELIRSVKVIYREADETEPARSVRGWHAVRRETGHVYEPAEKVIEDEFTKRLVLNDMRREWLALKRRYERFAEFADLVRRDLDPEAA